MYMYMYIYLLGLGVFSTVIVLKPQAQVLVYKPTQTITFLSFK